MAALIYRTLEEARGQIGPCALSIGNFDGVHCGHQVLFKEVERIAAEGRLKSAVLTFHPHPTRVVAPDRAPRLLTNLEQRCRWISEAGIEHILILPFNTAVAALSPEEFVKQILVDGLDAKAVLVGENFRFGYRQSGDAIMLRNLGVQYGFTGMAVPSVSFRGAPISSSAIRRHLLAGEVRQATRMLGRFHVLEGPVKRGHGIGSTKTVPTLNLELADIEVIPATGVYVSRTLEPGAERLWPSVTNIGFRPTFGGEELSVETHLLAPLEGDPPSRICVELTHRLREERRFENAEALKTQIMRDVGRANKWHRRWLNWRAPQRPPQDSPLILKLGVI